MKRLKEILDRQDMTCKQLAFETGLHYNTIVNVANYERGITVENAVKIADALNVSLDELCGREYNRKEFNETHAKLLNDIITKLVELEDEFYDG